MLILFSLNSLADTNTEIDLLLKGGVNQKTQFFLLPLSYTGEGVNPSYEIEEAIKIAISGAGLFSMPSRLTPPQNIKNASLWNFLGIRFVLSGSVIEDSHGISLLLSINDTLLQDSIEVSSTLLPNQLTFSAQLFADQVYRTLFYAAHTNLNTLETLQTEDIHLTNYMHDIIKTFKNNWSPTEHKGACLVHISQMPGGVIFSHELQENCFSSQPFAEEIDALMGQIEKLPYQRYQQQFNKNIQITFVR